jgi:hypothetical protein
MKRMKQKSPKIINANPLNKMLVIAGHKLMLQLMTESKTEHAASAVSSLGGESI